MKYFLITLLCLLLFACTDDEVLYSNTPDQALELLESAFGFVDNVDAIQEMGINDDRKIYVFEGKVAISDHSENITQYFVALVENQEKGWVVLESLGVGKTSDSESIATGGNIFKAGFINTSDNLQLKKNQYALNIPEKDYFIWVELLE